jgi:hypothetical protein
MKPGVGSWLLVATALGAACASEPPPPIRSAPRAQDREATRAPIIAEPEPAAAPAEPVRPPPSPLETALAQLGVEKSALQWSPSKKIFAVVVPPRAPATPAPRRPARRPAAAAIAVYSDVGQPLFAFRALGSGPVSGLRFVGEDRLMYALPARAGASRFGWQPIKEGAPAIPCEGRHFVFSPAGDHVAWVAGDSKRQRLYADGQAVYPRRGATAIHGPAAWSHDGVSLALIEHGARRRLVVLVEFDNPSGDNSWPLPPEAEDPSLRVFWAGTGKITVGYALTKPVFAASFDRQPNQVISMPAGRPAPAVR